MPSQVKENALVSPYFLFFLIHSSQTGVGLLRYQSQIIKGAGQDAWVSILVFGLSLLLVFSMMLHILKHSSQGDIISFHRDIFGKFVGGILNFFMAIYFFAIGFSVLQSYINVLQIWVFNGIASWEFSLIICAVLYYLVAGGFRIITGMAFWGVVIPSLLLFSIIYLFKYADYTYLLPLFNHSMKDYFISAKEAGFMYLGFEGVLVYFPFIKNGLKAKKWGYFGLIYTTGLYLVITLLTFTYFTQGKLQLLGWPTLSMIKIIQLSFIERFEFIFIFTWLFVIMPTVCLHLWSAVRIVKCTLPKVKPTYILSFMIAGYILINWNLIDIYYMQILDSAITKFGLAFIFGYIPLLFLICVIKSMFGNRKPQKHGSDSVESKL